jgi:SAM-dependent methyltransferase
MGITNKSTVDSWSEFTSDDLTKFGDDGDFARRELIDPAIFKLAGDINSKRVLDAGCGNGYLARKLARQGAVVTGVEPATSLYHYCVEKERTDNFGITYVKNSLDDLDSIEEFDIAFVINVLMDIPDYSMSLVNCVSALKPGGRIIISILHPAFPGFEDDWRALGHVEIEEYFDTKPKKQKYGHVFTRPISTYLNDLIGLGCEIKEIIEPRLPSDADESRNKHVPQFIIIKARKKLS